MRRTYNPFIFLATFAIALQSAMLIVFYVLPDSLGLSLTEMFSGKTLWQISMAFGAILVMTSIFAFLKKPRLLACFFLFYFILAIADYEVFRFSHQRLSYSFLRTYFHISNITDSTTISTLGGDLKGTIAWFSLLFVNFIGFISFIAFYSIRKKNFVCNCKIVPMVCGIAGLILSVIPLVLFLTGTRGIKTIPVINAEVDMRFTLGKHTLTAPILHIVAEETVEFIKDDCKITDELVDDLDSFLPVDFAENRLDIKEYPAFRKSPTHAYKAKKTYNIVFIFGESFKGRILNQMLDGDTLLAPNLWKLANGGFFKNGGGLWFKHAYSGGYPTVRGTMSTYLGFPSHPNRDLPSFYSSNMFKGFPEYLTHYSRNYVTISNPVFDHTLPFVEKFYGDHWFFAEEPQIKTPELDGATDSLGTDLAIKTLSTLPSDSNWFLLYNTIASHIPFRNYPDNFASKPDDALVRYRNAVRYTDSQLGRFLASLSSRSDFERTVIVILGDHDTPVDSVDYKVPQPIGVSAARIFMGIFSADSNLFKGLEIREDVASQLDIGPTILDLAQVRASNHFWGYDLLTKKRPADQPAIFFSENGYYLGFPDFDLTGGFAAEEVYKGEKGVFSIAKDSLSILWKSRAVGAGKVLRSLLRNDKMMPRN